MLPVIRLLSEWQTCQRVGGDLRKFQLVSELADFALAARLRPSGEVSRDVDRVPMISRWHPPLV